MDPFTLTQEELITYLTELGIEVSRGVLFMLAKSRQASTFSLLLTGST